MVVMNWRVQLDAPRVNEEAFAGYIAAATAGVAVLLSVVSFGPAYPTNLHPLATNLTRAFFFVLPPLESIREYDRIWTFGMLFLSIYVTVRIWMALQESSPLVRIAAAVVMAAPLLAALYGRQIVASAPVEAPKEFVAAALHSQSRGPMYVHPVMKWNSRSGVLMVAIARELGRPIVNGCLGICPPWFIYATSVLHRFPDPEALWLLRRWNVQTVVGVTGDVAGGGVDGVAKVYENNQGLVVWEIGRPVHDVLHPSMRANLPGDQQSRIDAEWSRTGESGESAMMDVGVAPGFLTSAVEIQFAPSVLRSIPDEISISVVDGNRRIRVNRDHAGEWIESLAADALVRRESPQATIALNAPVRDRFQIECRNSATPPIERIRLIGSWRR